MGKDTLLKHINPKFHTFSTPQRIDYFSHDVGDSSSNLQMYHWLEAQPFQTIPVNLSVGDLRLYKDGLVLLNESDPELPVKFFYLFSSIRVKKRPAIQEQYIWRLHSLKVSIGGLSLPTYCLLKILIPRYHVVVSAEEHTIGGEKLTRKNIEEALNRNLFIYITDESGNFHSVKNFEQIEVSKNLIWDRDPFFKSRLIVYSDSDLLVGSKSSKAQKREEKKLISALKKVVSDPTPTSLP